MRDLLKLATKFNLVISKEASEISEFSHILSKYENLGPPLESFISGWRHVAHEYKMANADDPTTGTIHQLMLDQAEIIENCLSEVEALDSTINEIVYGPPKSDKSNL